MELLDLHGRVAVVTGGGTGIGAATAGLLAAHGADVAIAARTVEDLGRTAARIEAESGRRCLVVPTDVKDEAQVVAMIERSVTELGRLDILVNNAGGARLGPLRALPTKAWDASFDLNVRSAYVATREAGIHFLPQRSGAIVNVSSDAGVYGVRGGAHYSAAKAALQMFTEVTAAEWGPHGIRANCVAVGGIASERAQAAWDVAGIDPAAIGEGAMLRRVGQPGEVAAAILFLVSDAASYVTAQTISVDGGHPMGGIGET
ncbi:MAG TPA: SDR family NAD(P)-dependent oxidoreductase [Acidimicrobiales bacterium]|nr:SDR family NAD(P)-dependent oxidoreductase [Acidimicrobiales bacterium]